MKKSLDWFTHPSRQHRDPRFVALRKIHGLAGYARYDILAELVADSPDASIDLEKKRARLVLEEALEIEPNKLDALLDFLSDPEIGIVEIEDNVLSIPSISAENRKAQNQRSKNRERMRIRRAGK